MGTWLFWPKKKTPVSTEHDLLLMGATNPAAANGYYDEAGMSGELKYYKHVTENYYICSPSVYLSTQSSWFVTDAPPGEFAAPLFSMDIVTGSGAPPIGAYPGFMGTGTVVVYPVNLSLSGAISPAACNGTYAEAGTYGGKPYYKHTGAEYYIYWESNYWMVKAEAPPSAAGWLFFKNDTSGIYVTGEAGTYLPDEGISEMVAVSMS
ncbi:MAG: hypothetical protein PHT33_14535 [bacterium]|nr:hypothetical protein [bacterium]